ncbi:Hint domain-containing protein [Sporomusa sphaeroides]|uniref:Hint domain-containing protein n=1 Tax=Sporomusa sphaeroides TaxID=47679 RepID=UPI003DA07064
MGGGKKQKQTTTTTPYSGEYASWVNDVKNQLWQKNKTPAEAYSGQLSVGMSDTQKNAMSGFGNLLNTGALTDTINGKFLDPNSNPYLSQYYDQAASKVRSTLADNNDYVNSQFNQRGLYNSSARQEALQKQSDNAADTMADMATNIYGGAYTAERQNQMNAIGQKGGLLSNYFGMGTTEQNTNQAALDAQYKEWLRQQGVDENDMDRVMQLLGLVKNPSQTTTSSDGGSSAAGAVGSIGSALITCFAAGTKISMPAGDKNIEDIQVGDKVYSLNDKGEKVVEEVINLMPPGVASIYDVVTTKGNVRCTASQPFVTVKGSLCIEDISKNIDIIGIDGIVNLIDVFVWPPDIVYDFTVSGTGIFFANGLAVEGWE